MLRNLKCLLSLPRKVLLRKKRGDISNPLGIVAVCVVMIAIIIALKELPWKDLATLVDEFVTGPLFGHITDPFN